MYQHVSETLYPGAVLRPKFAITASILKYRIITDTTHGGQVTALAQLSHLETRHFTQLASIGAQDTAIKEANIPKITCKLLLEE